MIKKLSKKHLKALRKLHKRPRSQKQKENAQKMGKRPNTEKQIQAARKNCLNRKGQSHVSSLNANTIVEHHNDLCRGKLRPDDITVMTHSEHARLHMNLHIENGTHPAIK